MLNGKTVIITGGAHGMGRSTAVRCAELGANVVVADINGDGAREVAEEISSTGGAVLAHVADVTDEAAVAELVDATLREFGGIDALHNNAYAIHPDARTDIANTSLESWDWMLRTCLTSQFLCCRAVLPHMAEHGGGSIVNVSSGNGLAGSHYLAAYGVAKAGVIALTKYVTTQYGKSGIRCNTIVPGWTLTIEEETMSPQERARWQQALPDVCMPRLAKAEDIARIVAFLFSDDAYYVQGAMIDVNGGMLAHLPGAAGVPAVPAS